MKPPYQTNQKILVLVSSISEKIGEFNATHITRPSPELRKRNRIKTIAASLSIEGNSFGEEEITAILANKKVLGPPKDIKEVQNAIAAYDQILEFKPGNLKSFLNAHKILMQSLIDKPGKLRTKQVGILKGDVVKHVAPPAKNLNQLMNNLFKYINSHDEIALIKSCVAHYEIEFIHPFMDGNGRMGRLWQTVILSNRYTIFEYLPFETIIKNQQATYYKVLEECDKAGDSTVFIEFILTAIDKALDQLLAIQVKPLTTKDRFEHFLSTTKDKQFTRKDYLRVFKDISTATASRDLKYATEKNLVTKTGDRRNTSYQIKKSF